MKPSVSIIGAGINGIVTCLALRLFGINATIYEKAPQYRTEGAGIYIWSQGLQILGTLLPKDKILAIGHPINSVVTKTFTDQVLQEFPAVTQEQHLLAPTCMFHRKRLYNVLLEAVGEQNIILNKECESVESFTDHAVAYFSDGTHIKSDLIIGADGIFSKVRRSIFPSVNINDSGVATCRGILDFPCKQLDPDKCYIFAGDHARLVTYSTSTQSNERYWFAAYRINPAEGVLTKEGVLKRFAGYPAYLLEMLAATPDDAILPAALFDLDPMPSWSRGNITLVGDAAHAMLPTIGYGFVLGMENAFTLAQALACNYFDIPAALKRYEMRALARSNAMMNVTRQLSKLFYFLPLKELSKEALDPVYAEFYENVAKTPL